jgi:tetratricopeptide (TPR) repeat protein
LLIVAAVLQGASASIYGAAASPVSIPAHLPPIFGRRVYTVVERMYPSSWIEALLARAALSEGDLPLAQMHVDKMDPSVARSELHGRLALATGDHAGAMRDFLDAVDIDAVQAEVDRLRAGGRIAAAYTLENAIRARLLSNSTHPDAVAESYWRSGVLASELGMLQTGLTDYRAALALAPFSEKYLLAAGTQSLELHQYKNAKDFFERGVGVDPGSADAYAGLGVVALRLGDRGLASSYERRSRLLDPSSQMLAALERELR